MRNKLMSAISNLELIFKYDVLREATFNFKEENKLGQGGFGSVFKVSAQHWSQVNLSKFDMPSKNINIK